MSPLTSSRDERIRLYMTAASATHTEEDIDLALEKYERAMNATRNEGAI